MVIRETLASDLDSVLAVERAAFGQTEEANLAKQLYQDPTAKPFVSLLACQKGKAIGHILFTRVVLEPESECRASILCPMAVIPKFQKQGIGGELISRGLDILARRGIGLVFVLGYPDYYRRFGFEPAGAHGFQPPYRIPKKNANAWMVKALQPDLIGQYQGRVTCADSLNKPEYWRA